VAKRLLPSPVSIHRQSIRPSTRFKRLPVLVSKADIVAYLKLSATDAQALFDSFPRHYLIEGVEKISKYALQTPAVPRPPQGHAAPSIASLNSAGVPCRDRKNRCGPESPPTPRVLQRICQVWCAMSARRTFNGALMGVPEAAAFRPGHVAADCKRMGCLPRGQS
jgi:hypothetical protein